MSFDKIVERKLWLVDSVSGGRLELCIEIGRPQWSENEVQATCPVCIRGLMSEPLNIHGSDLLNSLECGLSFVTTELKNLPANQSVQWPSGESYFD
jgi:hypothetical protein